LLRYATQEVAFETEQSNSKKLLSYSITDICTLLLLGFLEKITNLTENTK